MAMKFSVQCYGSILILVVLQTTNISALQCYGCLMGTHVPPELNPKQECLWATPPDELLVNDYSSIPLIQVNVEGLRKNISRIATMIAGPSCVKIWTEIKGQRSVIRYMMPEAPAAKFLDPFGCTTGDEIHMCFCRRDKCNNEGPQLAGKPKAISIESTKTAWSSGTHFTPPVYFFTVFTFAMLAGQGL